MMIQRVRTGAAVTILGLLAGCSGGGGTPAAGGKSGAAGKTGGGGAGGKVGGGGNGVGGGSVGGTSGLAGADGTAGTTGIGGSAAGGSTALGGAGGRGGAGGSSAAGGSAGVVGGGGTAAGGRAGSSAGGAGGTAIGAGGAGAAKKIGIVIATETAQVFPAPIGAFVASGAQATFGLSVTNTNACPTMTAGDCQLFECPATTTTTSPPPTYYQAGAVSIGGLLTNPLVLTFNTAGLNSYMSPPVGSYLWTASTPATVTVTGSADVPAYTQALTVPNPISITSPVATIALTGTSYAISKAGALNVTWTGGVDGDVSVDLSSGATATGQVQIHCTVAAAKNAVTVPATFMAKLGASGGFTAGVTSYADKTVGDWLMHFQASVVKDNGTATFSN